MRYVLRLLFLFPLYSFSQQHTAFDFKRIAVEVTPNLNSKEISGKGSFNFELLQQIDSIFMDAVNMTFFKVYLDGKPVGYSNDGVKLGIKAPVELGEHQLYLAYLAKPKQTVYFTRLKKTKPPKILSGPIYADTVDHHDLDLRATQVWTQGQGKYTSHWLPSLDDMTDKIEFDLTIVADSGFNVIANGNLTKRITRNSGVSTWHFNMVNPMSSYLVAFVLGEFDKKTMHSASGVPIELYYEPKDSLAIEPTYRHTKAIFNFLETEIGVPYPWQNCKQVPVHDFLYAGMENTGCTLFSNQYMIDSIAFVDKNYINVNAHELAHQWFGNLVTEASGAHHWLHEGFATYYAYLAEKELFGSEHFYWKLFYTARTLRNVVENGGGEALIDPKAGSLTFYEKGAWALVALKHRVGEQAFKQGVRRYLLNHSFGNVTITDFFAAMEQVTTSDLSDFNQKWLQSKSFPWKEAKSILTKNSKGLKTYFQLKESLAVTNDPTNLLLGNWDDFESDPLKQELINEFPSACNTLAFHEKIKTESLKVRQALALATVTIPKKFQGYFEDFLLDPSYVTQEATLFKLWEAFPQNRSAYLDQLEATVGLPNKNVRLLWLALALASPTYKPLKTVAFEEELKSYTSPDHNFEVRQAAFQYLALLNDYDVATLKNLWQACTHHVWQFKKTSRNLIRQLHGINGNANMFKSLKKQLPENEKQLLGQLLGL